MKQLEQNIVNSFRIAKSDIIKLQNDFIELNQTHQRILEMLNELNVKETQLYQKLKNMPQRTEVHVPPGKGKKVYVASKTGSKFHTVNCPFGQNIKPKSKLNFASKVKALNQGYKPCNCIK